MAIFWSGERSFALSNHRDQPFFIVQDGDSEVKLLSQFLGTGCNRRLGFGLEARL